MSESITAIADQSELFVRNLIQRRGDEGRQVVTTAGIVGNLAVPAHPADCGGTRLVMIAGGAASGKTNLAVNIASGLAHRRRTSAIISSDDFVRWDRAERHRREAAGMDPEQKYNFYEMQRAIGAICGNQTLGRTVEVPCYDSHTGLAIDGEQMRQVPKVDVLIAEGDMFGRRGMMPQDLYPLHPGEAFEPLTLYMHVPDAVRLARRIERDGLERNAQGATSEDIARSFEHRQTTQHFPYTLKYAADADAILIPLTSGVGHGSSTYDMYHVGSPL